ncbi:MAG: DUF2130 domain-containing protein [Candidatus Levybacteria bacterium]|nr:DUF2130 domain-containing protein [Candidatus Levybacteria bacterium]
MNTVVCPHCKKTLEISEAIIHQLQEQVRKEESDKLRAEFAKENAEKEALREKKLREQFENENKERVKQLELAKKSEKELEEKLRQSEFETKKREAKARELAEEEIAKKFQQDLLEEKKKNADMQKALEEAQRKAKQSSQQLQGEVLELDLETKLKETFFSDQFTPVPKGVQGGDIWQKIVYKGTVVGSILWETKNTKNWSKAWLTKLKDDAGRINASESIIVSQTLPDGVKIFDRREGVWVTSYEHAISTCRFIRFLITTVSAMKLSASQTDEEWGRVRDYMLSDSFKHRMQTHFDGIRVLREGLDAEKRATILRWKKQETQIEKLDTNTTNFYGELRAIVPDIPKIEGVDAHLLEDSNETETIF